MKDRVPTKPNRYAVYDDSHNFLRYEYHERADAPTQEGTALCKETLLSDATAGLYGLGAGALPDDVLALIKPMLDSKAVIVCGTYTGNGTTVNIDLGFKPSAVLVGGATGFDRLPGNSGNNPVGGLVINGLPNEHSGSSLSVSANGFNAVQNTGTTGKWYDVNMSGSIYKYIALR